MFKLLIVSNNTDPLSIFISTLKENELNEVLTTKTCDTALKLIKDNAIDLVITDEEIGDMSGLDFAKRLISASPMTNCVAVSSLSEKDFHEASEGLGLMNHLPPNPGRSDAEELLNTLRRIKGLESGQD